MNNNPDHISERLETMCFGVKILKFFDADPVTGMDKIRIRDGKIRIRDGKIRILDSGWKKFGSGIRDGKSRILDPGWKNSEPPSGINILDPQHWLEYLNSVMRIRYPGWKKFGSGMMKLNVQVSPMVAGHAISRPRIHLTRMDLTDHHQQQQSQLQPDQLIQLPPEQAGFLQSLLMHLLFIWPGTYRQTP